MINFGRNSWFYLVLGRLRSFYVVLDRFSLFLSLVSTNSFNSLTNSSLNLHIWKSTVRLKAAHNISPLKIPFEKCKSLGWLSEFCTTLFIWYWRKFGCKFKTHRIQIKINNLETEELHFETNMKLCNMRFEKTKREREQASHKKL